MAFKIVEYILIRDLIVALRDSIRIMIVDDMSTSRGLLTSSLQQIGVKNVTYETEGKAALSKLVGNPVHLVISDYNMPGMDGLQLLRALRENKSTARVGFIMVTGSEDREVITQGKKLGMNNFLKKPITPDGLKSCIEKVTGPL